jgi:predicted ATPase
MLRRIHIRGYKSLRDVEVSLADLVVLFGPNASGKSNFLDCLQLLSKLATSRTLRDAFDWPYRGKPLESFTFGPRGLEGAIESECLSFTIEADLRLSDQVVAAVNRQVSEMRRSTPDTAGDTGPRSGAVTERELRYRITVEMIPRTGQLRVADEYLAALTRDGAPTARRKPFISLHKDETRIHLRLEGQAHPTYHERYLDHSILSLPLYPPHYPHLTAARLEFERWRFFYFEPRERMRAPTPVKEVHHIGLMGEDLAAFLNTLKALSPEQFGAVEKAMRMLVAGVEGIGVEVNKLGEVELTLRENGIPVPARIVSEGTLRMLGLLALAGAPEGPSLVGFEEPENGIHPRRIALVAELLRNGASQKGDQFIVTTHSAIIPDLVPREYLLVCRKSGGTTSIEPFNSLVPPLSSRYDIDDALADAEPLSAGELMRRGDLDA